MRIFLADFGDLLGPLLLVLFAVLPRVFGSKKKAKKAAQKPVTPSSQPEEYKVPEYVEVGASTPAARARNAGIGRSFAGVVGSKSNRI